MSDRIADRLSDFDSSKIRQVFELARNLENTIDLSIGFPEENTPFYIKRAGINAVLGNKTKYLPTNGLPSLRSAVAEKLQAENNIKASADSVTITPGLTTAILLAYLAILNPGDEVLLPSPFFPPYKDLAGITGARVVQIDTAPSFSLSAKMIEKYITPRSKLLVINSPNNPTGTIYDKAELEQIATLAKKHRLIVISDEIYEYFTYDKPHFSIGSIYRDTLTLNGFSKAYAMTGWRIGYIHGPQDIIEAVNELQQYVVFSSSSIGQYAAVEALKHPPKDIDLKYKVKRDLALKVLSGIPERIYGGEGAFYLFLKIPPGTDDMTVSKKLIKKGVLVLPGSAFSQRQDYIRISFAAERSKLRRGLEIVAAELAKH